MCGPGFTGWAIPQATAAPEGRAEVVDFAEFVRDYIRAKFKGEAAEYYSDKVTLLPGHEYLKPEYGIAGEGGRGKAFEADRAQILKLDGSDALAVPPEKVEKRIRLIIIS